MALITGDSGNNNLTGTINADTLKGKGGNDKLTGGLGADFLNGGNGVDTANYSDSLVGVNVDLAANTGSGGTAAGDTYKNVENITGSNQSDTGLLATSGLFGNNEANKIKGLGGDDVLKGAGGADKLLGGSGEDLLKGGGGADLLKGGLDGDSMDGGNGQDILKGGAGDDFLTGGKGIDLLKGGSGADTFGFKNGLQKVDEIQDFEHGVDQIGLDATAFSFLGPTVTADELRIGGKAQDLNDFLIYNPNNGKLSLDQDGSGNSFGKTQFAQLDPGTVLDANDFIIGTFSL